MGSAVLLDCFQQSGVYPLSLIHIWHLSGETASIIVFVLWGTAEMSDLVRGALIVIPKHQYESAEALGMSRAQTYSSIIIPQTVRRMTPLSINLITRMLKTTSLVLMIGVVEVIKVAQQIIEANRTASPVSYTHLDVYKRQDRLMRSSRIPYSVLASVDRLWNRGS